MIFKKIYPIFLVFFLVACELTVCKAWAFWIWTPESKRWTNPKYAPKESPREQLDFAKTYFDAKDYEFAYKEFHKLVKHYSDAVEAPEAQYFMGQCLEEMGKFYEAYQAYQKIIDKYPFSTRTEDVLQKEYVVAQKLLDYKKKVVGIDFTGENAAIEIFRKIIENSPYGKYASVSQYKIGLTMKLKGSFAEARDEFQKVLDSYPESEWAAAAKYQIALCAAKSSLEAPYDQTQTQEAKEKFVEFARAHPDAEISREAETRLVELKDKEAESNYKVGEFYEKQKGIDSAKIYFRYVVKNFPRSPWAQKALTRMQAIERLEAAEREKR